MPNRTVTPAQNAARLRVQRKVNSGKLKRPTTCPKCGQKFPGGRKGLEWAHGSYTGKHAGEKSGGRWLCRSCHRKKDIGETRKSGAPVSHHQGQQK